MIQLYPIENETLVFTESKEAIFLRLVKAVNNPVPDQSTPKTLKGWVEEDRFELTISLRRLNLFMPLVRGRIEETSKGSLVFLSYMLFPATRLLITFWSVVIPLVSFFIGYKYGSYGIASFLIVFIFLTHWAARVNFRLHSKSTRKILHSVLD